MNSRADVVRAKRRYLEALIRERDQLEERSSYVRPLISAALPLAGIGLAALGTSVIEPITTFLGLCLAFAGVPLAVRSFVDARISEEALATMLEEMAALAEEIAVIEAEIRRTRGN